MKIHDRVIIPCDDDKVISGTVVGTTTTIVDPHDGCHLWSDTGTMFHNYVIRLDYEFTGLVGRFQGENDDFVPVEPRIPMEYLVVHEDNVEAGPWFVNVYEVDQGYGGAEEGGWWFSVYDLKHTEIARTYADAERRVEELRAGEWADDPDARVSSVAYSGGVYTAEISDKPGGSHDTYQSYC